MVRTWESEMVRTWESEMVRTWESEMVRTWESDDQRFEREPEGMIHFWGLFPIDNKMAIVES